MTDLTVRLGPLQLKNPVMAASCEATMTEADILACIDAGAGAVVAKSVNESPAAARQLNIAEYALLDRGGALRAWPDRTGQESLLCRSGLCQQPLEEWLALLERVNRYARAHDAHVIGSVTVAEPEPAAAMARAMAEVTGAIELNVGAPHGREASAVRQATGTELVAHYTRTVRAAVDAPLIVKLPAQSDDPAQLADAARRAGADVVALMGRHNGFWPDVHTGRPVLDSWGAVGGPEMLPLSLYWVSKAYLAQREAPLIGSNGARSGTDVARFLLSGASAVELASVLLLRGPQALTECIREFDELLHRVGYPSSSAALGVAAERARPYAAIPEQTQPYFPWTAD